MQVEPPEGSPWMTLRVGTVELNLYLIDRWLANLETRLWKSMTTSDGSRQTT